MDKRIKRILDCLNKTKTRATYGAVRDLLDLDTRPNWGELLGVKCPYSSWVVRKSDGLPSRYKPEEMHPDLEQTPKIIRDRTSLKEFLNENNY